LLLQTASLERSILFDDDDPGTAGRAVAALASHGGGGRIPGSSTTAPPSPIATGAITCSGCRRRIAGVARNLSVGVLSRLRPSSRTGLGCTLNKWRGPSEASITTSTTKQGNAAITTGPTACSTWCGALRGDPQHGHIRAHQVRVAPVATHTARARLRARDVGHATQARGATDTDHEGHGIAGGKHDLRDNSRTRATSTASSATTATSCPTIYWVRNAEGASRPAGCSRDHAGLAARATCAAGTTWLRLHPRSDAAAGATTCSDSHDGPRTRLQGREGSGTRGQHRGAHRHGAPQDGVGCRSCHRHSPSVWFS